MFNRPIAQPVHTRLYLDFDGTLTGLSGNDLVNRPFYKTVTNDVGYNGFKQGKSVDAEMICANIKEYRITHPEETDVAMTPSAIFFIQEMLRQDAGVVEIIIVSKNFKDYIEGVLLSHDFSREQIDNRVKIFDLPSLRAFGSKEGLVASQQESLRDALNIHVYDDSTNDLQSMCNGVGEAAIPHGVDIPGTFDFEALMSEVKERLGSHWIEARCNDGHSFMLGH